MRVLAPARRDECGKWRGEGGIGFEPVGDFLRAGVGGRLELDWDGGERFELVEDHVDEAALGGDGVVERADFDGFENEFAEERGDVHGDAGSGWEAGELRNDIEGTGFDGAGEDFGVLDAGGNPDGAVGRHNPGGAGGLDAHDALGGVGELVPIVCMCFDYIGFGEGYAEGADQDGAVEGGGAWLESVAGMRHSLAV